MRHVRLIVKNTLSHSLTIAVGLLFTIGGARLLTVSDYGEVRYAMTLLPLFMAFSLPGYDSVILRNANLRKRVPLLEIFFVKAACALLGSLLIAVGMVLFRSRIDGALMFCLGWAALLLPFFETGTGYRNYLIGMRLRHAGINRVMAVRLLSLVMLASSLAAIYVFDLRRIYLFPAYLLSVIVPTLIAFFSVARGRSRGRRMQRLSWLDLPAAVAATLANLVYTFAYSLDKLLVRNEMSAAELAAYAILIMAPQELSKLLDATVPLFYRHFFFAQERFSLWKIRKALLLLPPLIAVYIVAFYHLSGWVFGAAYHYPLHSVVISGLMIGSLSFEYLSNHRIFATHGSRSLFFYSLLNLALSVLILPAALLSGGIDGLLLGLIAKQLITPNLFLLLHRCASRSS